MKARYIKPSTMVININSESILAASDGLSRSLSNESVSSNSSVLSKGSSWDDDDD